MTVLPRFEDACICLRKGYWGLGVKAYALWYCWCGSSSIGPAFFGLYVVLGLPKAIRPYSGYRSALIGVGAFVSLTQLYLAQHLMTRSDAKDVAFARSTVEEELLRLHIGRFLTVGDTVDLQSLTLPRNTVSRRST